MAAQRSSTRFALNELLVGVHEGDKCPYEAKVIAIKEHKGVMSYKLHYSNWASRYDRWVAVGKEQEGRMFKGSVEEYVERNRVNIREDFLEKHDKKVAELKKRKLEQDAGKRENRRREHIRLMGGVEYQWTVDLSKKLKRVLREDYKNINGGMLCHVPATVTVDDIVEAYSAHAQAVNPEESRTMSKTLIAHGVRDYFNTCFGACLLYKHDRPQYEQLVAKTTSAKRSGSRRAASEAKFIPSKYYGLVHLLRMLSIFPRIMVLLKNCEKTMTSGVQEFVNFLDEYYDAINGGGEHHINPASVISKKGNGNQGK